MAFSDATCLDRSGIKVATETPDAERKIAEFACFTRIAPGRHAYREIFLRKKAARELIAHSYHRNGGCALSPCSSQRGTKRQYRRNYRHGGRSVGSGCGRGRRHRHERGYRRFPKRFVFFDGKLSISSASAGLVHREGIQNWLQ